MFAKMLVAFVILLAILGGAASYRWVNGSVPPADSRLTEFSLADIDGVIHSSAEWKGRILVINFWATWCPPCREEIPDFIRLQKELGDRGVQFIGIAIEDAEPVREFLRGYAMNYPNLVAGMEGIGLSVAMGNSVRIVPFSAVVDRDGRIVHMHPGKFAPDQLREQITPLL